MIRPTLRAALLFAPTLPAALLIILLNRDLWPYSFDLGLLVLAGVGVDALLCASFRALTPTVDAPARVYVGDAANIETTILQSGRLRASSFDILPELRGPFEPPEIVDARADAAGRARVAVAVIANRRGLIEIDALWLRWRGPLGLTQRLRRVGVNKRIEVLPDVRSIHANALQFVSREAIDGIKVQTQKGEGAEFESLRDHAAGLDNRFIDWKHSAKHRKLLSKEFRIERNHHIVLAFDTGHLMAEPLAGLTRLDHAIHAGLQLGWISLRHGDFVGSFGFDARVRQYVQPARGMSNFMHLQRGASQLGYHTEETNFTLGLAELNARLKRRALVVLFTEFVDTTTAELLLESVHRIANRHVVVFAVLRDPLLAETIDAPPGKFRAVAEALVARDFQRERAIVLERLQRMGVHCLEAPARALSVGLVNRYLMIKNRGLI